MGGCIFCSSTPGQGSTFGFAVPLPSHPLVNTTASVQSEHVPHLVPQHQQQQVVLRCIVPENIFGSLSSSTLDVESHSEVTLCEMSMQEMVTQQQHAVKPQGKLGECSKSAQEQQGQGQGSVDEDRALVVVVEDDPLSAEVVMAMLRLLGYRCVHADTGMGAMELICGHGWQLHVQNEEEGEGLGKQVEASDCVIRQCVELGGPCDNRSIKCRRNSSSNCDQVPAIASISGGGLWYEVSALRTHCTPFRRVRQNT